MNFGKRCDMKLRGLDDHAIQFKYLIDTKTKLFV